MTELQNIRETKDESDQWNEMISELNACDDSFSDEHAYRMALKAYTSQLFYK